MSSAPPSSSPLPPQPPPPPGTTPVYAVPPGYQLVPIPADGEPTKDERRHPPPGTDLPYEDGDPVPPGYRVVERMRRGLVIAGSIVLGTTWAFSVTGAAAADFRDGYGLLVIPALGPWLTLATRAARDRCGSDAEECPAAASLRAVLVLDGLTQVAGATMLGFGLFVPRKRLVRSDFALSVVPSSFGLDGYGLRATGRF